jgi:hypothetical protein
MECRTGLCGRTGLTSGADEFFSDLYVQGVLVLPGGDHGNTVFFLLRMCMSYDNLRTTVRRIVCSAYIFSVLYFHP